ncbi:MAG: hypothetical protein M3N21_06970, partial [Actinomycetota bacterium]|nr:hypothetical protein [Actinomycetota bacterium]
MINAANIFGWGGVVLSVACALVLERKGVAGSHVHLLAVALWGVAGAVNMACVTGLPALLRAAPGLAPHLRAIKTGLYVSNLVVAGGLVAVAGGL